jgi:lysozyme
MEYIRNFNDYNDNLVLEKLDIKSLFNNFKTNTNIKIASVIVGSLLTIFTSTQAIDYINRQNINNNQKEILIDAISKFKVPTELHLSQKGWDHIRNEEKLVLKAYNLGDNHITIGYGHAQPEKTSKYRVGKSITKEKANKLFREDVNEAAEGVKRMFRQWKEQGIDVKVTQNQYDAMVSIAFNMGVEGFRKTEFVQQIKRNQLDKAAELIKVTGISDDFPGLETRRLKEYQTFVS